MRKQARFSLAGGVAFQLGPLWLPQMQAAGLLAGRRGFWQGAGGVLVLVQASVGASPGMQVLPPGGAILIRISFTCTNAPWKVEVRKDTHWETQFHLRALRASDLPCPCNSTTTPQAMGAASLCKSEWPSRWMESKFTSKGSPSFRPQNRTLAS